MWYFPLGALKNKTPAIATPHTLPRKSLEKKVFLYISSGIHGFIHKFSTYWVHKHNRKVTDMYKTIIHHKPTSYNSNFCFIKKATLCSYERFTNPGHSGNEFGEIFRCDFIPSLLQKVPQVRLACRTLFPDFTVKLLP